VNRFAANLASTLVVPAAAHYILRERRRLEPLAVPVPAASRERLWCYFEPADLERVRIAQADPLPVKCAFRPAARFRGRLAILPNRRLGSGAPRAHR
jgi:hypothetical protein